MFFTYRGKSSKDFGLKIININNLSSPKRNITKESILGRNGDLLIDNNNYENFTLEIECDIVLNKNQDINTISDEIKKWLYSSFKYDKLILNDSPELYYEAVCINKIDISMILKNYGSILIIFDCKPFKKYINGNSYIDITLSKTIYNGFGFESYPILSIYGNGNITLNINNQSLILKDIENKITIDSEMMNAYKIVDGLITLQNNKMYSDFPTLDPGENKFSWIGNIEKIEVMPRWAKL